MTGTSTPAFAALRPLRQLALAIVLLLVLLLGASSPTAARAAEGYNDAGYTACGPGKSGGGVDRNGRMYIACNSAREIHVRTRTGVVTKVPIVVPAGGKRFSAIHDVAPSPTGTRLYVSANWVVNGVTYRTLRRLNLNSAGRYSIDQAWAPKHIPYGARTYLPQGVSVATDGLGDIYWANGQGAKGDTPSTVVKYRPSGAVATLIGDGAFFPASDPRSWTLGLFFKAPVGVAASRDGRHVFAADSGNQNFARFDLTAEGSYRHFRTWGNSLATDPARRGSCNRGMFGAIKDVGIDPWDFVYVMNTSCERVHKYTVDGAYLGAFQIDSDGVHQSTIIHRFGVDGRGNVYAPEKQRRLARTTPVPTPFPGPPVRPTFAQPAVWTSATTSCSGAQQSEWWAPGATAANTGTAFQVCGTNLLEIPAPGVEGAPRSTPLPAGVVVPPNHIVYDLAASPDGSKLYVTYNHDSTGSGVMHRTARRLNRQADGSYALDATWRLRPFPYGARTWVPDGLGIATDAGGHVYFSNGLYPAADTPSVIVKYAADGTFRAWFGEGAHGAAGSEETWALGTFTRAPSGLGVSRDGRHVWVGAFGDHRVQRFVQQANGSYAADLAIGSSYATDPQRGGRCVARTERPLRLGEVAAAGDDDILNPGGLAVVFKVAVDPEGAVWANSVSCRQVSKFDSAGRFLFAVQYSDTALSNALAHSFVLDGPGRLGLGETVQRRLTPPTLRTNWPPAPAVAVVDTAAPTLAMAVSPSGAVTTRSINVTLTATDDVGVTMMRVTNDANDAGQYVSIDELPWVPYRAGFLHQLRDSPDTQAVMAQVRDGAGNESPVVRQLLRYTRPA